MLSFFSNAFFLFLRKRINLTRIGVNRVVCMGVSTVKNHGSQKGKGGGGSEPVEG